MSTGSTGGPAAGLAGGVDAVVVASHGGDEVVVLRAALDAGVAYIGLVASPKRGAAVLDALGLAGDERQRVCTPAGLDIGSRTPPEIAVSILAEIVSLRPRAGRTEQGPGHASGPVSASRSTVTVADAVTTAVDPVCGMRVAMVEASRHLDHDGRRYWFCGSGCEQAFRADPVSFVGS